MIREWIPQPNRHSKKYHSDGTVNLAWKPRSSGAKGDTSHRARQFLSFDGEGVTLDDGSHIYNLLACSDGSYIRSNSVGMGLTTAQCLDYLCTKKHEYETSIFCVFGAGYDINMWLGDLPRDSLRNLWETRDNHQGYTSYQTVDWTYELKYRPRKSLSIRRYRTGTRQWIQNKEGKWMREYDCSLIVYDVFGFFQSSFVEAIRGWLGPDYADTPIIAAQKKRRSQFKEDEFETVLSYCQMELRALQELMRLLNQYLNEAGITISQWDGAGAIAAGMLKKYGIKDHLGITPTDVQIAARHAYAGGRIELLRYGTYVGKGNIHHYDVNSAYPSACLHLPSLVNGRWRHIGDCQKIALPIALSAPFSLFHICWNIHEKRPFYPLFYRTQWDSIWFPRSGEGWYWGPEAYALIATCEPEDYTVHEIWTFEEYRKDVRPFDFIRDVFRIRQQWKADKNPAEKVLKLGLNSLYGKLAQHVGSQEGNAPTYHCLEWAGFITSYTRAKLYLAAWQKAESIISFQTDGIVSIEPLDLQLSKELGDWDYENASSHGTWAQAGVYFLRYPDEPMQKQWLKHYRGFDGDSLDEERIRTAWFYGEDSFRATSTIFVGMGTALVGDKQWDYWRHWREHTPRNLSLYPETNGKRVMIRRGEPWHELVETEAQEETTCLISKAYPLPWEPHTSDSEEYREIQDWETANI